MHLISRADFIIATLKKSTGQEVYEYNRGGKNHHPLCNGVSVLRWVGSVNESERSLNHHPSISSTDTKPQWAGTV